MRATRLVLSLFVLVGCNPDYGDFQKIDSDPPDVVDTDPGLGLDQPKIQVTPERLTFGALPPGCASARQVVTIENIGSATLEVDPLEFKGAGNAVFGVQPKGPFTLQPGEKVEVRVGFVPADYAIYDKANLVVTSNDPARRTVRVGLAGEGFVAAMAEELFLQEQADAVDVLWVIDNSCSMADDITRLGNAIGGFINQFVTLGLDYRMGVTTTDMDTNKGKLMGPVMEGAPDDADEFKRQTNQGSSGSADEKGFAAARAAVDNNYFPLRDEATFAVVVVADEDDRDANPELGGGQKPNVTDNFVAWLRQQKSDPGHTSFSAMTCPATGGGLDGSCPQYHRAIRATNGVYGDINNPDFTPFLTHLSFAAAGLKYEFPLSNQPTNTSPSAITVRVDGDTIPFGTVNGWTYDAQDNAIVLWGNAIPDPGEDVFVRYPYDAGCD